MLQFRPGTDVALLNAIMNVIVAEELYDRQYIEGFTEGFDAVRRRTSAASRPRRWRRSAASRRRRSATSPAPSPRARAAMIFWGMGISQHIHGTDNSRCLISLALLCGQVGRPGTGLHPLRGQNNVQGASDAGLIPMVLPDYQPVEAEAVRELFRQLWQGTEIDAEAGADRGRDHRRDRTRARSAACTSSARTRRCPTRTSSTPAAALAKLEHLVVQDVFLTETANYADVILPALGLAGEDRHGDEHQPPGADGPQGAASRRARRARTGASSSTSPTGSGSTGTTTTRARSSPR